MKNQIFKTYTFNKSTIKKSTLLLAATVALSSSGVMAKASADDAAKLGNELTPMGANKAANSDGSIPEWTGGITKAPAGYNVGDHNLDPFPNDKIK
jgi:hypothetical protein